MTTAIRTRSDLPHRQGRRHRLLAGAALALALLASATACGDDDPSASGSSESPTSSTEPTPSGQAYSTCMRENGVPSFPDPDPEGRLTITGGPGSELDPGSPEFQAAEEACADLRPAGTDQGGGSGGDDQMLKYSQCMRDNGVPNFPDPENGALMIGPDSGIDPDSAAFQQAQEACASFQPGGMSSGGGQ